MVFLKQNANSILLCVFEAIVGILLLVDPVGFTSGILMALGIVLLIVGVISVIGYIGMEASEAASSGKLLRGLLALAAGFVLVFHSEWLINAFPVFSIFYGLAILVAGIAKIQWAVDRMRLGLGHWGLPALSAVVSVLCAIVILANPFETMVIMWMFTGASLVVEAIFDLVVLFFSRRYENEY